ncbi:MAG TPA: hypothetical protein DD400_01095 [Rhodospirillaceae bacterium]|nr:hypothetical protein [Rhodospirillaceae bacterium]
MAHCDKKGKNKAEIINLHMLIRCEECKRLYDRSKNRTHCPHCGHAERKIRILEGVRCKFCGGPVLRVYFDAFIYCGNEGCQEKYEKELLEALKIDDSKNDE